MDSAPTSFPCQGLRDAGPPALMSQASRLHPVPYFHVEQERAGLILMGILRVEFLGARLPAGGSLGHIVAPLQTLLLQHPGVWLCPLLTS